MFAAAIAAACLYGSGIGRIDEAVRRGSVTGTLGLGALVVVVLFIIVLPFLRVEFSIVVVLPGYPFESLVPGDGRKLNRATYGVWPEEKV
jgi:hypothetical protein